MNFNIIKIKSILADAREQVTRDMSLEEMKTVDRLINNFQKRLDLQFECESVIEALDYELAEKDDLSGILSF